eukprot:COSAG05_NODE_1354_length_5108_cov_24.726692_4_plen_310_part_00
MKAADRAAIRRLMAARDGGATDTYRSFAVPAVPAVSAAAPAGAAAVAAAAAPACVETQVKTEPTVRLCSVFLLVCFCLLIVGKLNRIKFQTVPWSTVERNGSPRCVEGRGVNRRFNRRRRIVDSSSSEAEEEKQQGEGDGGGQRRREQEEMEVEQEEEVVVEEEEEEEEDNEEEKEALGTLLRRQQCCAAAMQRQQQLQQPFARSNNDDGGDDNADDGGGDGDGGGDARGDCGDNSGRPAAQCNSSSATIKPLCVRRTPALIPVAASAPQVLAMRDSERAHLPPPGNTSTDSNEVRWENVDAPVRAMID